MKNVLKNAYLRGAMAMCSLCENVKAKMKEEKGGSEIIAIIILIVIVVLLAVAFRGKIGELVDKLWNSINGATDTITASF